MSACIASPPVILRASWRDPVEVAAGRAAPPFQGGVAGLAAYELGDRVERLSLGRMAGWPDLICGRYDTLLAFDHHRREVLAIGPDAKRALAWLEPSPQ